MAKAKPIKQKSRVSEGPHSWVGPRNRRGGCVIVLKLEGHYSSTHSILQFTARGPGRKAGRRGEHVSQQPPHSNGSVPTADHTPKCSQSTAATTTLDWISESISGGSLRHVDPLTGTNGWATPPPHLFSLRSNNYFVRRHKAPSSHYLLSPAGMDWLKSPSKLDNVLARPDNRISLALRSSQASASSLKAFIFAVNLQVPGKDHHSAVFYFATDDPIPTGSPLRRFINGDDSFRNQRFKIVNRIVKGPWIVKKAVGNYRACLLGKALTCNYHRGSNFLEIDVDIGSSALASAILRLALGYVTNVTIDMGFLVEAQAEDELPEKLIGAVRVCQMEMSSATTLDAPPLDQKPTVTLSK